MIARHGARWKVALSDYWTLTKPEVNLLILMTMLAAFWLASPLSPSWGLQLFNVLVGTMLVASGTGALNQYIERCFDGQMRRTAIAACAFRASSGNPRRFSTLRPVGSPFGEPR